MIPRHSALSTQHLALALNSDQATARTGVALNIALGEGGQAPDWVELLPAGPVIEGIDGRRWVHDRPQGVLAYFARLQGHNRALVIDWEHASEHRAPVGEPAPAAAWVEELEIREGGAIWGRVEWTPRGLESVANREYRYLSPVLVYEKESRRVAGLASAGLTNKPNLKLQALNRAGREGDQPQQEDDTMWKRLLAALALPETASEDEALNAVGKLKGDLATAANRAENPSLEKFVPRADYDQALTRATNAEQALAARKKDELETAITAEIEAALKAGKITPATADYHRANCRAEGGLELFRKFVAAAPVVGDASGLDNRAAGGGQGTALNAEEKKVCESLGISEEEYKKAAA